MPDRDTDEYVVHKSSSPKPGIQVWLSVIVSIIAVMTTLWTVAKSTAQYDATVISVAELKRATSDFANVSFQLNELRKIVDKQNSLLDDQNRRLYILEARRAR